MQVTSIRLPAFSPFPILFSIAIFLRTVKSQVCLVNGQQKLTLNFLNSIFHLSTWEKFMVNQIWPMSKESMNPEYQNHKFLQ